MAEIELEISKSTQQISQKNMLKAHMRKYILDLYSKGLDKDSIKLKSSQELKRFKSYRFKNNNEQHEMSPKEKQLHSMSKNLMKEVDDLLLQNGQDKKYFKDDMTQEDINKTVQNNMNENAKKKQPETELESQNENESNKNQVKQENQENQENQDQTETLSPETDENGKPDCNKFCQKLKNKAKSDKEKKDAESESENDAIESNQQDNNEDFINNNTNQNKQNHKSASSTKLDDPMPADISEDDMNKYNLYYVDVFKSNSVTLEKTKVQSDESIIPSKDPNDPNTAEDENDDLTQIHQAKVLDRLPTLEGLNKDLVLQPDEFFGFKDVPIYKLNDKGTDFEQIEKSDITISKDQIRFKFDDKVDNINTGSIIFSCNVQGYAAMCSAEEFSLINGDFKTLIDNNGIDVKKDLLLVLESSTGYIILKMMDVWEYENMKFILLYLYIKNLSRSSKFTLTDPKGNIVIDNNAGALVISYSNEKGPQIENIPTSSLEDVTINPSKPIIKLVYSKQDPGSDISNKIEKLITVPKSKLSTNQNNPLYIATQLVKNIDSAINVYFYYYLNTKAKKFVSGISDLKKVQESQEKIVNIVYKFPLKALKALDNQMAEFSCMDAHNILTYVAKDYSFGNPFVLNELLYYYYVKNVFPSVNPSFEKVEFTNKMELFDIKLMLEDGITIKLINRKVTQALSKRWLYIIKTRICDSGSNITFEDYLQLQKFSLYHWDLLTNPKFDNYKLHDVLKMPQVQKPDTKAIKNQILSKKIQCMMRFEGIIKPQGHYLKTLEHSMDYIKILPIYVWQYYLNEAKSSQNETIIKQLEKDISTQTNFGDDPVKTILDIIKENNLEEFLSEDHAATELGPFDIIEPVQNTIKLNVKKYLQQLNPDLAEEYSLKILNQIHSKILLCNNIWDAIESETEKYISSDEFPERAEMYLDINDIATVNKILSGQIPCQKYEKQVKNLCEMLNKIKQTPVEDSEINNSLISDSINENGSESIENKSENKSENANNINKDSNKNSKVEDSSTNKEQNTKNSNNSKAIQLTMNKDKIIKTITELLNNDTDGYMLTKWIDSLIKTNGLTEEIAQKYVETYNSIKTSFIQNQLKHKTNIKNDQGKYNLKLQDYVSSGLKKQFKILRLRAIETLKQFSYDVLKNSLAKCLSDKKFTENYKNIIPGEFEKLEKISKGNNVASAPSIEDIEAWNDLKIDEFLTSNPRILPRLVQYDNEQGLKSLERSTSKTLLELGHLDLNNIFKGIEKQFKSIKEDDKTQNSKLSEDIMASELTDIQKIDKILKLSPVPKPILGVLSTQINEMSKRNKAKAINYALLEDEEIVEALAESKKLQESLSTEDKREGLKTACKSDNSKAKNTILKGQSLVKAINQENAKKMEQLLIKSEQSALVLKELNSSDSPEEKIAKIVSDPEKELELSDDAKILMSEVVDTLDSEQTEECFKVCSQDPECLASTGIQKDTVTSTINPTNQDVLKDLSQSPEEKKLLIKNMIEKDPESSSEVMKEIVANSSDEDNKVNLDNVSKIESKLSDGDKVTLADINNSIADNGTKCLEILNKESMVKSDPETIADCVKSALNNMDDDKVNKVFKDSLENPKIVDSLMKENKDLETKIDCIKDKTKCNEIYDENGDAIQLNNDIKCEQLEKLMTLESGSDGVNRDKYDGSIRVSNMNECKVTVADAQVATYKDIVDKKSIAVFDKSLSYIEASKKKLIDEAAQAKDLQSAKENIDINSNQNQSVDDMLNNLKENMENEIDKQLNNTIVKEILKQYKVILTKDGIEEKSKSSNKEIKGEDDDAEQVGTHYSDKQIAKMKKSNHGLYQMLRCPEGMVRVETHDTGVQRTFMRVRLLKDLIFGIEFDEIIAKAIKMGFIKGKEVYNIKSELLNYYADLTKEVYMPKEGDDSETIISKIQKLQNDLINFTVNTDFGGHPKAKLDFTHFNLDRMYKKYKIDSKTKNWTINPKDLRTIIAYILNYNDIILSKPVFVMQLKNKMRKAGNDATKIAENIVTGSDANLYMYIQKNRGFLNLAFFSKFKAEFVTALTPLIGAIEGDQAKQITEIMENLIELSKVMTSLYGFIDSLVLYVKDGVPGYPETEELTSAYMRFETLLHGVKPLGDFWVMNKLKESIAEQPHPTQDELTEAALTIYRMRSNEPVFRSVEFIKGIQKLLRGEEGHLNIHKNIEWLFFMNTGDYFLDYMELRNKRIEDIKNKKVKGDSEDNENTSKEESSTKM